MKKIIALILCMLLLCGVVLTGCNEGAQSSQGSGSSSNGSGSGDSADPMASVKATASTDKYRNFYQIFVHSFADSDGDQTGDLQGIIDHLDYLNDGDPDSGDDLGIDAIWLTPIMPSKSYHKYDVENYYDIDPDFGTLETFDTLLAECHKRGINLIMDLVLNHISSNHPLFQSAFKQVQEGKLDGDAQYFEIRSGDFFSFDTQVIQITPGYVCEANFSQEMPEWDLNSEKTREEFTKIAKFWLDRGVDGFRLDACKYFTNPDTDGVEFLSWFMKTCREIKPDVYVVGENWDDDSEIEKLFKSGIDSQFAFRFAQSTGAIISAVNGKKGKNIVEKVKNYEDKMRAANPDFINTLFLSNHDQVRVANGLQYRGLSYEKFTAGVYLLFPGNPFIYYGEEIGIKAENTTNDAAFRTPMVFDSDDMPTIFVNGIGDEFTTPKHGGVKQQLADENSLLNYYRRAIRLKVQNPELARGQMTVQDLGDGKIGAYTVDYEGSELLVVHNFDPDKTITVAVPDDVLPNAEIRGDLVATDDDAQAQLHVTYEDGKLILPPHSSVVMKSAA